MAVGGGAGGVVLLAVIVAVLRLQKRRRTLVAVAGATLNKNARTAMSRGSVLATKPKLVQSQGADKGSSRHSSAVVPENLVVDWAKHEKPARPAQSQWL